ncbi:hypothetical protein ACHQM5_018183 [Ranunculus cassubicifolius]
MEALWKLEDKWKLTNQGAILLFACTALAVVGLCTTTIIKKKKEKKNTGPVKLLEEELKGGNDLNQEPKRKLLMDYMRWSERSKWDDLEFGSCRKTPPLLLGSVGSEDEFTWSRRHRSSSPVWQRPILMGEKCELPRFSGLILYDEQGQLLDSNNENKPSTIGTTTLRDLF